MSRKDYSIRYFVASVFLSLFCQMAQAQFEMGLKAGGTISGTHLSRSGRSFGPVGGFVPELQAGYSFGDFFRTDLGLGYVQRGFSMKAQGGEEHRVRYRYFSLPVYATLQYPVLPRVEAGVLAGFGLNLYNSQGDNAAPFSLDRRQMNSTVSFLCGIEAGYKLKEDLTLNVQYRYATDMLDADEEGVAGRLWTHQITLGVTYVIDLVRMGVPAPGAIYW